MSFFGAFYRLKKVGIFSFDVLHRKKQIRLSIAWPSCYQFEMPEGKKMSNFDNWSAD